MPIQKASSITHQHILTAIATEMRGRRHFHVVDIGCGGGKLCRYLETNLSQLLPECRSVVTGFDVSDFAPHGNTNIGTGTQTIKIGEPWPFDDSSVDVMISNQVLEHVSDHQFFFSQLARCLKPDGVSIHLAPVREVAYDGHVCQPFVHKIRNRNLAIRLIGILKMIGFYSEYHAAVLPKRANQNFSEFAADYLATYCNYISMAEMVTLALAAGLKISFDYTPYFYEAKLLDMAGRAPRVVYPRSPLFEHFSAYILRYVSSITVVLRHR